MKEENDGREEDGKEENDGRNDSFNRPIQIQLIHSSNSFPIQSVSKSVPIERGQDSEEREDKIQKRERARFRRERESERKENV